MYTTKNDQVQTWNILCSNIQGRTYVDSAVNANHYNDSPETKVKIIFQIQHWPEFRNLTADLCNMNPTFQPTLTLPMLVCYSGATSDSGSSGDEFVKVFGFVKYCHNIM